MHTNTGLAATIKHFLDSTKVANRTWTPESTTANVRQRRGFGLYNDHVAESNGEWEVDGD